MDFTPEDTLVERWAATERELRWLLDHVSIDADSKAYIEELVTAGELGEALGNLRAVVHAPTVEVSSRISALADSMGLDSTVATERALDAEEVMQQMREFRKGNTLDGLSIRELIDDGRK